MPWLQKRDDVRLARSVNVATERHPYREVWVATDRVLLMVALHGPSERTGREIYEALAQTLDTVPPPLPIDASVLAPLQPWLAAARAAPPDPTPSWQYRLHQAAVARIDGADRPCHAAFADALAPDALANPTPIVAAAFHCATALDDPEIAEAALVHLDKLEPGAAMQHAYRLINADQPAAAIAVLDRVVLPDGADAQVARELADMRLAALMLLRRWDEVEAIATDDAASPRARAVAGGNLIVAGRAEVGWEVLEVVCGKVAEEDREPCAERGL